MTPPTLTTESGAPVPDNQNSQTAGPAGPVLLQDQHLLEKLATFNRERIPERVVHAKGGAAHGRFVVTQDVTRWTSAHFLGQVGRETDVFLRLSTVAGELGSADTVRDPRGFAVKFYTEEGNYDLVGNNTPVFFIRDPLKFPDFIHTQKRDPYTHRQEPENVFDFFSLSPELTHQFTWLFGDRGLPYSWRHMDGFGSHTFQWRNQAGEAVWVKYHFKTDQGIRTLTTEEGVARAGLDPNFHINDLREAIDRGEYPSWTLKVQIMPVGDAATYRFNPFDLTKVWSQRDYPLHEVGRMRLDRNPDNYFAEVEQSAFDPGNFVPGIGPSPDKMLQARLFAYGDAHRYRLGINHTHVPINTPRATTANTYARDGLMRVGHNGGREKNYEPNSFGGPAETGQPLYAGVAVSGTSGTYETQIHAEDDDFVQAGMLYRLMDDAARDRLARNLGAVLAKVERQDIVDRSMEHFRRADVEYGRRVEEATRGARSGGLAAVAR